MKNKNLVMLGMVIVILLMSVVYAAFSTNILINGTTNIDSTWRVVFTDIEEVSKTSGVNVTEEPTATGTTATFNVGLTSPGDSIEYRITVHNQGTLDAVIKNISISETGSDAINFSVSGIEKGDTLEKNEIMTFDVVISYDESVTQQPSVLDNKLTIYVDYVQDFSGTTVPSEPEDALAGTWVWNFGVSQTSAKYSNEGSLYLEKLVSDSKEYSIVDLAAAPTGGLEYSVNFISDSTEYSVLGFQDYGVKAISYDYIVAYDDDYGWYKDEYKTITIKSKLSEVDAGNDLLAILSNYATKIS